jgi:D-alanine transaminase
LPGITRSYLSQLCRELGIPVRERAWLAEDLFAFHEVFICSSIRELVPVVSVDGRKIGSGVPGPIFQRLLGAFRARAAASTL